MKKFLALALTSAAAILSASSANATSTLVINSIGISWGGYPTADLYVGATKTDDNVPVVPQDLSGLLDGNPVNLFTYCIDIYQNSGAGTFSVLPLGTYLSDPVKYNQIAALISAEGTKTDAAHDAAVQLALWELINETSSTRDVNADLFHANDFSSSALPTLANAMLSAAVAGANTAHPTLNLYAIQSDTKQDLLFWTISPPAVPEPASWAMMILGLGAVGGAMRYSSRKTALRFA